MQLIESIEEEGRMDGKRQNRDEGRGIRFLEEPAVFIIMLMLYQCRESSVH